jgi:hypothetical protein
MYTTHENKMFTKRAIQKLMTLTTEHRKLTLFAIGITASLSISAIMGLAEGISGQNQHLAWALGPPPCDAIHVLETHTPCLLK